METLEIGALICRVKRSKRRSVCLRVARDGTPEVLAPLKMNGDEIKRLMLPYSVRIARECERMHDQLNRRAKFVLDYGSRVRFLGEMFAVASDENGGFCIPDSLSGEALRLAVIDEYKRRAREYLKARVAALAAKMGLSPSAVRINSARTRWASCSGKGTLNFSWLCMMAPPETVDYIIIHELCHMREFNHSPKFWAEVEKYCPDYKSHRSVLRALSRELSAENWSAGAVF